jgi:hypothetical protein
MPPTRLLVKDFITSLVTSEGSSKKIATKAVGEKNHTVETMVISDDENDASDVNILRRKALQREQDNMQAEINKKKEVLSSMEKKMKNMKLDVVDEFEI